MNTQLRSSQKYWKSIPAMRIARTAAAGLLALTVLVVTIQMSVAGVFRGTRPQIALAWAPSDAQARARLAVSLLENQASELARERAIHLAHDALRREPIAPVALRALAVAAGSEHSGRSLALISAAHRLSRRDQATQLWLIEHQLRQGRPQAAMQHFDIALRTSLSSRQVMFPLLANVLTDQRLFDAMLARMREKPEWAPYFLAYLIGQGRDSIRTDQLAREFLDPGDPAQFELIENHLQGLAAGREFDLAWDTYNHFGLAGEGTRMLLKNGDFERASGVLPFTWWYAEEPDLWAEPLRGPNEQGIVLQVAAVSGRTGEVARQLVKLPLGRYRVQAKFGNLPDDAFEYPELRLSCAKADPSSELLRLRPIGAGAGRRGASASFTVPSGCPFQWISIAVAGDRTGEEPIPWVDDIQLSRIGS